MKNTFHIIIKDKAWALEYGKLGLHTAFAGEAKMLLIW